LERLKELNESFLNWLFLSLGLCEFIVLRLELLHLLFHLGNERLLLLSNHFALFEALGKFFELRS